MSETLDFGAAFLSYNGTRGGTVLLHFLNVLLDQRSSVSVSWFDIDRKRQSCVGAAHRRFHSDEAWQYDAFPCPCILAKLFPEYGFSMRLPQMRSKGKVLMQVFLEHVMMVTNPAT